MEFKKNLLQTKKRANAKAMKEKGAKKIKIRGRKRWVKPAAK